MTWVIGFERWEDNDTINSWGWVWVSHTKQYNTSRVSGGSMSVMKEVKERKGKERSPNHRNESSIE